MNQIFIRGNEIATKEYVDETITKVNGGEAADLSNYYTKEEVEALIAAAITSSLGGEY